MPLSASMASLISRPLPTAMPRGLSISVMTATVYLPRCEPISTMRRASALASSTVRINAPPPVLTSSTIASAPAASFLLIMLEAMSGMLATVPLTSLRAYMRLSAGSKLPDWPITQRPVLRMMLLKLSRLCSTHTPGTDSSLSSVPPECAKPLPLILATVPPHAATSGATMRVVVSPTPPVECLSTLIPPRSVKSTTSPECIIAKVRSAVSSAVIPRQQTAIIQAVSW